MMNMTTHRRAVAALLAFGLLAAACSSSSSKGGGGTPATKSGKELAAATLNGSGATFPQAFYETAIAQFQQEQPSVTITYAGGGSGKGQTDLQAGLVQWAGSDSTVKREEQAKFKGPFLYFPTVAAPITVSYNVSSVKKLQLSADTLARIFQGDVKTWDDAAIKADNPGRKLPSTAIVVAHRSDGSGTTANFTKYLTKAAPSTWKLGTDKTVAWPAGQQAGNGNAGVAQIVKGTNGAIGYVDLSDAKASGLVFASIKNASGTYAQPTLANATAALKGTTVNANLTYDPLNATGPNVYPITAPTYILVYTSQSDANVKAALQGFLDYLYGGGQDLAASVDFAKLPASILSKAKAQVGQIGT